MPDKECVRNFRQILSEQILTDVTDPMSLSAFFVLEGADVSTEDFGIIDVDLE